MHRETQGFLQLAATLLKYHKKRASIRKSKKNNHKSYPNNVITEIQQHHINPSVNPNL